MLEVLARSDARTGSYITWPGYRAGMKPPNAGKRYPAEVYTRDEVNRMIGECSKRGSAGLRTRALIVLLYRTGLRIDEALELRPKDIEGNAVTVLHGKGDRARRVGIDDQALAVVDKWRERRRALKVPPAAPLFCVLSKPRPGGKMYSSVVREALKEIGLRAGIEKRVHPHGFRHTYASELMREGIPLPLIQRLLGHKDLATTAAYINHIAPWEIIDAIRAREAWSPAE